LEGRPRSFIPSRLGDEPVLESVDGCLSPVLDAPACSRYCSLLKEKTQAPQHHNVVVDEQNGDRPPVSLSGHRLSPPTPARPSGASGMTALTSVPAPGRLRTVTSPPSDCARSRMPMRPKEPPSRPAAPGGRRRKPAPLSRTINVTASWSAVNSIRTRWTPACRFTLLSAS